MVLVSFDSSGDYLTIGDSMILVLEQTIFVLSVSITIIHVEWNI